MKKIGFHSENFLKGEDLTTDETGCVVWRTQLKEDGKTLGLAFLLTLAFLAPFLSGLEFWGTGTDLANINYPLRGYLGECLRQGIWPRWNPYPGVGLPLQTGARPIYSPLVLATAWLPVGLHIKATLGLHIALALGGMACMLQRLGLSRPAALVGGTIYACSGYTLGHSYAGHIDLIEVLPFFPLVFWTGWRALVHPGLGWTLVWSIVLALTALSGHFQEIYMMIMSVFLFQVGIILAGSKSTVPGLTWKKPWATHPEAAPPHLGRPPGAPGRLVQLIHLLSRWVVAGILALALDAFQLLPATQSLAYSGRLSHADQFNVGQPGIAFWLTLLLPQLFEGSQQLLWWSFWPGAEAQMYFGIGTLAWIGIALRFTNRQSWLPPMTLLLVAVALTFGPLTPLHSLFSALDPFFFKNFRAAVRFGMVVGFFAGWVAALGVDQLRTRGHWWTLVIPGLPLLALSAWLLWSQQHLEGWLNFLQPLTFPDYWPLVLRSREESHQVILDRALLGCAYSALLCGLALLLGWLPSGWRSWGALLLIASDLSLLNRAYLVMVPPQNLGIPPALRQVMREQPGRPRVMWNPSLAWLGQGTLQQIHEVGSYDSISHPAYARANNLLEGSPGDLPRLLIEPWSHQPFWNLQGVALIYHPGPEPPWPGLEPFPQVPGLYRNPQAQPRLFVAGQCQWQPDPHLALQKVLADPIEAARCPLVDRPSPPPSQAFEVDSQILDWQLHPNQVTCQVAMKNPGLLVLTEGYWPGWKVRVNGRDSTLYSLNGGLHRGVWLEPGQHQVVFAYWPDRLTLGISLSSLSALLLTGLLILSLATGLGKSGEKKTG